MLLATTINIARYSTASRAGQYLLLTIAGILVIQTYFAIVVIDIKARTKLGKAIAKILVIAITGIAWGLIIQTFDRASPVTLGGFIGVGIAALFSRRLPWTGPDLLPYEIDTQHLHIRTDLEPDPARFYANFLERFTLYFKKYYFGFRQEQPLTVYLFGTTLRYELYNRKRRGPLTPYGYYCGPKENLAVVNLASGLGTATHELVHHFVAKGFTREACPQWVNEGLAMFFEKFIGYFDTQGTLMLSLGYFSDWRFPQTKRLIKKIKFDDLVSYRYDSPVRDFMLFLHRKGLLNEFINRMIVRRGDPTGALTLQQIYGQDIPTIVAEWKDWVRAQPVDGNVRFVKYAFVKTYRDWESWRCAHQGKMYWDERLKIYVVGKRL